MPEVTRVLLDQAEKAHEATTVTCSGLRLRSRRPPRLTVRSAAISDAARLSSNPPGAGEAARHC